MSVKILFVTNFFLILASCTDFSYHADKDVSLYYRDLGGNNGYESYLDYAVLINYSNKSRTFRQLYETAKRYIDTVKADLPVGSVTFIGQKTSGNLPKPGWNNFHDQKKHFIVSFAFNNGFKETKRINRLELNSITIWRNSSPELFLVGKDKNKFYNTPKGSVDSLMNSSQKFDNDF